MFFTVKLENTDTWIMLSTIYTSQSLAASLSSKKPFLNLEMDLIWVLDSFDHEEFPLYKVNRYDNNCFWQITQVNFAPQNSLSNSQLQ